MRIAHLADLHLGYRAYHRVTPRGINVREADVSDAFHGAIEKLVALRPDLVLIAGDVFHTVRPSNKSIAEAFRQFASLTARLPETPVVMIAGNHDSPRSADTGNILSLFREIPNFFVVTEEMEPVHLPTLGATVLCLPHNALARAEQISLEPDPRAAHNVLMLHATIAGAGMEEKIRYISEYGGVSIDDSAIHADAWDYVALGHYHIETELAPNMRYAGAIERTSTNVWVETGEKGFLTYDTASREAAFHALVTRPLVDLGWVEAGGLGPSEIDALIARAIESIGGGLEGKIVRLVLADVPRQVVRELDHRKIRDYRAEALHFHLDARPPEIRRMNAAGAPMRRQSLRDQVESYLAKQWQPTSDRIDRDRLVSLARGYMDVVGEGEE